MAKKKGPDMKRILIEEGKSVSPFQNIVLKEKKEEKKPLVAPPRKKPNEIVQGYVPSASFADILDSYEKTGNPYSMPKKKASAGVGSSSFGSILDEWEGKGQPKKKKSVPASETPKSQYQPTRSFGDILSSYDKSAARKMAAEKPKEEKKAKPVDRDIRFFLAETEEDKVAPGVSWSIYGGVNKDFKREEPKKEEKVEEPKYVRSTPRYVPQKSFEDILAGYGDQKRKKAEAEAEAPVVPVAQKKLEMEEPEEPNFFQEMDEGESVPSNVSWSIYGGANKGYVRPVVEEKKEEEKVEKKPEPVKPVSKPYVPKKEFGEILSSYSTSKARKESSEPVVAPKTEEFEKPEEPTFFQKMEDGDEIPKHVSWSVFGGVNSNYVRPEQPKAEEKPQPASVKRSTDPYVPTKSFGKVLKEYQPQESPKTFDEIIRDKGDRDKKARSYTINELRRMDPQTTLDLHGETQAESEAQVKAFLEDAKAHGLRKISIITGKGLHSEDGQGVLKALCERILDESGMVAERSGAPLSKGGSGAIWVILKEKVEE